MTACKPNLPQKTALLALCGRWPPMLHALRSRGVEVVELQPSPLLPAPIAHHADILCCHCAENTVVSCDRTLTDRLLSYGINVAESALTPGSVYPDDCGLNCLVLGDIALGRTSSLDPALLELLRSRVVELINTRQGYARCSVAPVDSHSVITADRGIAGRLTAAGFDVLLISPGGIALDGYDTGFIGGCCGKLSANRMLFCGDLMTHPDGGSIAGFLAERGVSYECSHDGILTDFGGFIPLCE